MLVANSVIGGPNRFDSELARRRREGNKLAARELLRGAAFVGMNMCNFGAEHGMIRMRHRLQAEDISRSSIENKKYFNVATKVLTKLFDRRVGKRIVAVTDCVSLVGRCNGAKDLRMNTGIVVAGETANWFHACQCSRAVSKPQSAWDDWPKALLPAMAGWAVREDSVTFGCAA
jgi:hypothetical protein